MKIKLVAVLLVLLVIIVGGAWLSRKQNPPQEQTSNNPITIRVAYGPYVNPIFIALDKGYFEEAGLKVNAQFVPGTDTTTAGLTNGDLDSAWIPYSVLYSFEQAKPGNFKIFSNTIETVDKPYSYLIVKNNIKSVKDLQGKKILVRSGSNGRLQAEMILKALGLDLKKIEIVQVEASVTPTTFAKNDISAAIDIEPSATAIIQQTGGKILVSGVRAKYITDPYPTGAQVFSTKFVKEHPQEAEKFRIVFDKAIDYMNTNDQDSRSILQKYLKLDSSIVQAMAPEGLQKYAEMNKGSVEKLMQISVQTKQLDKPLDLSSVYYEQP